MASGGLPHGRLLQRLEGLVDKVHRFAPHLTIFGPLYEPRYAGLLYRERERLGKLATNPDIFETLADKFARMSRYITLLQRLMALVPGMAPQDVSDAVQEATKIQMQQAYTDAVAAHAQEPPSNHPGSTITWHESVRSRSPRNRQSVISTHRSIRTSSSSPRRSSDQELSLGRQVEDVLKMELPLSIQTIAFVARMVIVAWTLSVGHVAWEEGESGMRLPALNDLPDDIVFC